MIQLLTLLCSLCINFAAVQITPFDYSIYEYISTNDLTTVTNLYGWDVSTDYIASYHQGNYPFVVVPYRHFVSSANDWGATYTYFVNDDNEVIGYRVVYSNVRVLSRGARGGQEYFDYTGNNKITYDCYFNPYNQQHSGSRRIDSLNTDYLPYVVNDIAFVINGYSSDDGPSFSSSFLGNLTPDGHSSSGSGIEGLENFNWSTVGGVLSPSGHSHAISQNASYDFTDPEQNLLGQIVNNTNNLISNSYNLGEVVKGLASNMIKGFSALFNGLSTLNDNVVNGITSVIDKVTNLVSYVSQPYDRSRVSDYLEDSHFYQYQATLSDYVDSFNDNVNTIKSGILTTETQELVIPIDFHEWFIVTEDYGNITPYNATHYMRFPFLDETKALWQPLLLGFLYLSLIIGLFFDSPAIVRGVMNT